MRSNRGSIRMVFFLRLLMLPRHCSVKFWGSLPIAAKLKWIGHLTRLAWKAPSQISSTEGSSMTVSTRVTLAPLLYWSQPSLRIFNRSDSAFIWRMYPRDSLDVFRSGLRLTLSFGGRYFGFDHFFIFSIDFQNYYVVCAIFLYRWDNLQYSEHRYYFGNALSNISSHFLKFKPNFLSR